MSRKRCALPEAIVCRGLSRRYPTPAGWVDAFADLDATFASGAISAVIGPSGSGKSTLLRVLAGIDPADAGEVVVAGADITKLNARALRRRRRNEVTYLAQRAASNLVPHLTVREQLGRDTGPLLGLEPRLDAVAGSLSGGEQARASLAVGLSRGTPVVLVDEPTAELDRATALLVLDALRAAADAGTAVLVATHDDDLIALADKRVDLAGVAEPAAVTPRPRSTGEIVVAVNALSKTLGGMRILDGATLELGSGEIGALIGRSGSGKSTLLMIMAGFLGPDAGSTSLPGMTWAQTSYLPQRFGLLPELSIAENVALPRRLGGRTDDVSELLEQLGLSELADRLPTETSIGQQQRAALARALAIRPAALLADEPTSHQDAGSAQRVWAALADAAADGTACLVATHDATAAAHADRVWHIADGRVGD
jgi:putative ABC transport system ATP-binding protein